MKTDNNNTKQYFDSLYRDSDDPWKIRGRWYERRKRALTLASLPHERYARAFEPGCGNGELTALLAARCEELIATDISEDAVALTRRRVAEFPHVKAEPMLVPDVWPAGKFDLVVVSEIGYYLDEPQLWHIVEHIRRTLSTDGAVVACHWRRPIEGWSQAGDEVHAKLRGRMSLPLLCHYWDDDLVLDVWATDPRSVYLRETPA
ncbi:class I SAM-dependent methyltransferase [Caballeronia ptereochthonis]|jgi:SAM-dependent methyltransferase|uniref:Methyltransferase small n=1 Tax=Caballeronia ptereochthonis TaxID=1777144 RepID=A0A158CSV1_9BURK|nr:SAM-dependent methyltransferase [Caballeronia ptereochthonis]SAK85394.1 methyltransferase small [Caballeronia ptereochthonis]